MSKQKSFEATVRAMSAADIIRAMVRGLRKRWVRVDMCTFGEVKGNVCFGCAATNAICEIAGKAFTPATIGRAYARSKFVKTDEDFLEDFETDLDDLRQGETGHPCYMGQLTDLPTPESPLPYLGNDYTEADLAAYEAYADYVDKCQAKVKPKRKRLPKAGA